MIKLCNRSTPILRYFISLTHLILCERRKENLGKYFIPVIDKCPSSVLSVRVHLVLVSIRERKSERRGEGQ